MKTFIFLAFLIFASSPVFAEGGLGAATDPQTIEECGACHMVYPPKLLGAKSWQTLLTNLDNHFGEDASLDAATQKHISNYLMINAGRHRETPDRITQLSWFKREHINRRNWKSLLDRKKLSNGSNCIACHKGAEKGYFED